MANGILALMAVQGADAPATFKVSEFEFERPTQWEWVASNSPMRKAQLNVGTGDKQAEVIFYHFGPGSAGGTQANVDRWVGQFQDAKDPVVTQLDVGGHRVTIVETQGTYMSGLPAGPKTPKAGYALLGAIIEADGGSVFVKMTGPKDTVSSSGEEFRKMIRSGLEK